MVNAVCDVMVFVRFLVTDPWNSRSCTNGTSRTPFRIQTNHVIEFSQTAAAGDKKEPRESMQLLLCRSNFNYVLGTDNITSTSIILISA
jgi:hypothetical protein